MWDLSEGDSTSSSAPEEHASVLDTGSAIYKPRGCKRYTGAALPPEMALPQAKTLEKLDERLERLRFGPRLEGHNPPPLEAYTVTPAENGDVVSATQAYRDWFLRAYPAAGPENSVSRPAPGPASKGVGRKQKPISF